MTGAFFLHCIQEFLVLYPDSVFLVTSDDPAWCRAHLTHPRLLFPRLLSPASPTVTDFLLMTQAMRNILLRYNDGKFGIMYETDAFWSYWLLQLMQRHQLLCLWW